MANQDPGGRRNTNALAMVAGALLALLAVLGFLALISHRAGAEDGPATVSYEIVGAPAARVDITMRPARRARAHRAPAPPAPRLRR